MPNDANRRNITEGEAWIDGIYQLEENDQAEGGPEGIMNQQAKELAARTRYLKTTLEKLAASVPGTEEYNKLLDEIKKLDITSLANRTDHLERLVGNAYLAFKMANIDPDGYDGMIIETFDGTASEIDQAVATVTSVVSGDDSIDVTDSTGLIIGAHYQLTDGEKIEEVQVKSLNVSGSVKRIILKSNVVNQYTEGRAKLYRSSVAIYGGRAYGGGNTSTQDISINETFSGSNTKKELTAVINFSDPTAFELHGGHIENGKIMMGTAMFGIALNAYGSPSTGWKQINADCDDLAQSDLA